MDLLAHPVVLTSPRRLSPEGPGPRHLPLAMLVVDLVRPAVLVELGTRWGDLYCASCQAVAALGLPTRCCAVGAWRGDGDPAAPEGRVLRDLRAHHDPLYRGFSSLVDLPLVEAAGQFGDGTIDLLQVEGEEARRAVARDLDQWRARLSPRGTVLLHGLGGRSPGSGTEGLWETLRAGRPHWQVLDGPGLGLVAVGPEVSPALLRLLQAGEREGAALRELLDRLGRRLEAEATTLERLREMERQLGRLEEGRAEAARLGQALEARGREVARLRAELATTAVDRAVYRHDLEAVLGSRSWRITGPLRWIAGRARPGGPAPAATVPDGGGSPAPAASPVPAPPALPQGSGGMAAVRSLGFGGRSPGRYWWHRLPGSDFVPPLYAALDDREWEVMDAWFRDTDERVMHGEINVTAMAVLQGFITGSLLASMVQLGIYAGYSALLAGFMMRRMGRRAALLAVDIDPGSCAYTEAWIRRAGLEAHVRVEQADAGDPRLPELAREYFEGPIESVLIDASHEYAQTAREIDLWLEALRPGGLLFLHDASAWAASLDRTGQGGVHRALAEWRARSPEVPAISLNGPWQGDAAVVPVYKDGCGLGIVQRW